jgi:hypothetical protein
LPVFSILFVDVVIQRRRFGVRFQSVILRPGAVLRPLLFARCRMIARDCVA